MSKSLTKSIIIASDHAGFLMKEKIKIFLNKSKIKTFESKLKAATSQINVKIFWEIFSKIFFKAAASKISAFTKPA